MRIHVVGAQETNAPWAFELRIIRALQAIGHNIISTDFRQDRSNLPDKLRSTHADHLLVFKGDWVPASAIETVSCRKTLWYAEYVGRVSDLDLPAFRNREVLRYNCRAFDQVLIHDPSSIAVCRRLGAREVHWLSCVMVDTVGFSRLDVPKKFDVLFIGSPTPRRKRIIAELAAHYDVHWLTVWSPEALVVTPNNWTTTIVQIELVQGRGGTMAKSQRRMFTADFKAQVVLEELTGVKDKAELCREYRLHPQVFSRWREEFLERSSEIFATQSSRGDEQERIAELERIVGRLTVELEAAKKVSNVLTCLSARNGR